MLQMADPKHSSEESLKDSPSPNIQAVASIRDVPDSDKEKRMSLHRANGAASNFT